MKLRGRGWSFLVLGASVLMAAAVAQSESASDAAEARGIELYGSLYCSACHQLTAANAAGIFGPPHDAMGVIAEARLHDPGYRGSATTAEGYIRESILAPEAYRVPGYELTHHRMPAYTSLTPEELDALVLMLLHQNGQR